MAINQSNPVSQVNDSQARQVGASTSGNGEPVNVAKVAAKASSSASAASPESKQQPKPPTRAELERARTMLEQRAERIANAVTQNSKQLVSSMLFEGLLRRQEQVESDARKDRIEANGPSIADAEAPIPMSELFALGGRNLPDRIAALAKQEVDVQVQIEKINERLERMADGSRASDSKALGA